jgi:hypothetical protein
MSLVQDKSLLLREYTMTSLLPINVLHKTIPILPTVPTIVPNPLQITTPVQNRHHHNHPSTDYPQIHTPHNPTVSTPLQTAVSSLNVRTTVPTPCPPHPFLPPTTAPTVSQHNVHPTADHIPSPPRQTEPTLPLELLPNPPTAVPCRAKTDEACRLPHLTDEGVAPSLPLGVVPKWISQDQSNLVNKSLPEVPEEDPPLLPLRLPVPDSREYEKKVQNTIPLPP